jgi:hypothetical protein
VLYKCGLLAPSFSRAPLSLAKRLFCSSWGSSLVHCWLVEDGNQAEESSTDHKRQQSGKERVAREGPAEEEGAEVGQKNIDKGDSHFRSTQAFGKAWQNPKNFCGTLQYLKIAEIRCGLCSSMWHGNQGSFNVSPKDPLILTLDSSTCKRLI